MITDVEVTSSLTRGYRKRARTHAGLVEAALRVLARKGAEATAIQDVTTEAGLANGTFYNHFATKEELLAAVASHMNERFAAEVAASFTEIDDPAERLALALRRLVELARNDPTFCWVMVRFGAAVPAVAEPLRSYLRGDIRHGVARRRFHLPHEAAALDLVLGAALEGLRSALEGRASGHAGAVAELVLRALGLPARVAEKLALQPLPDGDAVRSRT